MKIKILISTLAVLTLAVSYFIGGANFIEMISGYGAFYTLSYAAFYCFKHFKGIMVLRYMSLLSVVPAAIAYFLYLACDPAKLYPHTMATLFNLTEVCMGMLIVIMAGVISGAKK